MKTRIFLFFGLLLLSCSPVISQEIAAKAGRLPEGTINVLSSPDLFSLTTKWAGEYNRLNPQVNIQVTKGTNAGIAAMLKSGKGIGFVSNESDAALHNESALNMVVGRDVIVSVMNAKNPFLVEINQKGISPAAFAKIIESPEKVTWGDILGNGQNVPVHCYMVNDASVISGVENFLKTNQHIVNTWVVESGAEMTAALQKDPNAIGFCRMVSIIDANNQNLAENIKLLPIDKNGNGNIDYMEKIYGDLQSFSRGVWIGKYPKSLSGNIFAVSAMEPANVNETAFLTWVLTDGQQFLNQQGFSDLVSSERHTQLDKLISKPDTTEASIYDWYNILKVTLLIILAFAAIGFIMDRMVKTRRKKMLVHADSASTPSTLFDEESVIVPKGLYFDKTHTWAFMEKDGKVRIGIDDFLQHITGPISGIGMKPAGVRLKKGDPLLTILQKGKHLLIYSPVSGTITDYNQTLSTQSSALNAAPYSDGWVYTIEPTNWLREIQFLITADKYRTWLKDEFSRLKDFFATALTIHTPEYAHVVLQDGGVLNDNILADLGPRIWEDFQTKFIDNAR